ncbi:MAG: tyrosine-type recombinase/integrase [Idiomarina sp.]|nr:tyrosine-type recombinase/integrase [Idiomarina sp.]
MSELWALYEQKVRELDNHILLEGLVTDFFNSPEFHQLKSQTQQSYRRNAQQLLLVFGKMHPDKILPKHIRVYMDKRGMRSTTQANREKAFLSRLFQWGYERGRVSGNPTKGVRQFKETPRDKYVTDEEYNAIYQAARDHIKVAMELSYLCCARQGDVLEMRKDQILEQGLYIKQGKTGKAQIKAWSPRLIQAIELAKTLPLNPGMATQYVIHKRNGARYLSSGFRVGWDEARAKAREQTGLILDLTFHDLKAKGISDIDGSSRDKQEISGHKTERQVATYDRKVAVVPTVEGAKTWKK